MPSALTMAEHLLTLPPASRVNTVHMMRQMRPAPAAGACRRLAAALHEHGAKSDLMESRAAFAEKRKPQLQGLERSRRTATACRRSIRSRAKPAMASAKPTVLGLAADLAAGRTTSRALVEAALARIADPAGEGARTFTKVYADRPAPRRTHRTSYAKRVTSPRRSRACRYRSRICSMSPARLPWRARRRWTMAAGRARRADRRSAARRRRGDRRQAPT